MCVKPQRVEVHRIAIRGIAQSPRSLHPDRIRDRINFDHTPRMIGLANLRDLAGSNDMADSNGLADSKHLAGRRGPAAGAGLVGLNGRAENRP